MKKILISARQKPINVVMMLMVLCLYFLNNLYLKGNTSGVLHYFLLCHFNDLICPLFFLSYSNLLLIAVDKELKKLGWVMLIALCSGLLWEFFAPIIKKTAVTDFLDLLFYLVGAFLYWCIVKISSKGVGNDTTL